MLYWLKRLEDERRIPVLPVYVDSPMAIGALQFYSARLEELDAEMAMGSDPSRSNSPANREGGVQTPIGGGCPPSRRRAS